MDFRSRRGSISQPVVIVLILIAVMLVVISIPVFHTYKREGDEIGCMASLNTAADSLTIEYITQLQTRPFTVDESKGIIAAAMPGRDHLCPKGGSVYFVPGEGVNFELICGLHSPKIKLRTRLNAVNAMELAEDELLRRETVDGEVPDVVSITLNSRLLECQVVEEPIPILHGRRATTKGFEGTVAFLGVSGERGWKDTGIEEGHICYFFFADADEDYYAYWTPQDGWSGNCLD